MAVSDMIAETCDTIGQLVVWLGSRTDVGFQSRTVPSCYFRGGRENQPGIPEGGETPVSFGDHEWSGSIFSGK